MIRAGKNKEDGEQVFQNGFEHSHSLVSLPTTLKIAHHCTDALSSNEQTASQEVTLLGTG
jgi:hypothetical protein